MKSESQAATTQTTTQQKPSFQNLESETIAAPVNLNMVTRESILQLQGVIGNQAVQRLMGIKSMTPQVQRADAPVEAKTSQGLLEEGSSNRFAQTIFNWTQNPANADKQMADFTTELEKALNVEMDAAGAPHVHVYFETLGGPVAQFDSGEWKVELDCDVAFGGTLQKVSDLSEDQLTEAVNTLYHEARHAEQDFLIARMRTARMLDAGQTEDQIMQSLITEMGLNDWIAAQASQSPWRDADADSLKLIESLESSMYGEDSTYRNTVYSMYDLAVKPVFDTAAAVQSVVPGDYDGRMPEEQEKIKPQVEFLIPIIETHFAQLERYRDSTLQTEAERVVAQPISIPPGNNGTMLDHLNELISRVNTILRFQPFPSEPMQALEAALLIQMNSKEIKQELLEADLDLPEQVDADKAGQQAGDAFAQLGQPAP
jgi:hypothetical protein